MKLNQQFFWFISLLAGIIFAQEIKIATLAPEGSLWGSCLDNIKKEVWFESKEKIRIRIFYGGKMGDEDVMVKKIKINAVQGGAFTGNGLGAITQEVRVLECPRLFRSYDEVDYVQEKISSELDREFMKNGFKLVGLIDTGFAYFFSKQNIKSLNDVRAGKMWMWQGDMLAYEIMNTLEIKARALNFIDVISSMQTGLIDGFYTTPMACISLQWFIEARYMLDMPISSVSGALVIAKTAWEKLPPADQKLLSDSSRKYLRALVLENRKKDAESLSLLKQNKITINKSADSAAELDALGRKVKTVLEGKLFTKEISARLDSLLAEFRSRKK
ncbi:MAG: hypothetical protein A2096_17905 [Spirochaetes bacterium GWF1_41_5]|nr:MAG: hypothetical protein A2096_17905 [Spirochaetes bacterium GWF1_41_5]HBE04562.1 hypothetical protein [Spirochaetia bacterium]